MIHVRKEMSEEVLYEKIKKGYQDKRETDDVTDLEEEIIRSEVKETVNDVKNQLHKAVLGFQVFRLNNGIYRIDNYKNMYITCTQVSGNQKTHIPYIPG